MDIVRVGIISPQGWHECRRLLGRLLAGAAQHAVERGELAVVAREGGRTIVSPEEAKGGERTGA